MGPQGPSGGGGGFSRGYDVYAAGVRVGALVGWGSRGEQLLVYFDDTGVIVPYELVRPQDFEVVRSTVFYSSRDGTCTGQRYVEPEDALQAVLIDDSVASPIAWRPSTTTPEDRYDPDYWDSSFGGCRTNWDDTVSVVPISGSDDSVVPLVLPGLVEIRPAS